MRRVIMFGGCASRPALDMNAFLTKHPNIELLDVKPVADKLNNIVLVCTVDVPEDLSGLEARFSEYFGFEEDEEE